MAGIAVPDWHVCLERFRFGVAVASEGKVKVHSDAKFKWSG